MPPLDDDALQAMNETAPSEEELDQAADPADESQSQSQEPAAEGDQPTEGDQQKPDAEPQADAAKAEDEKPKPERNRNLIARHRYNYQKQQRDLAEQRATELERQAKALKEENERLKAQGESTTTNELEQQINDFDLKIEEARIDGDAKEAARLRAEQRKLEQQLVQGAFQRDEPPRVDEMSVIQRASENLKLEQTIATLEQQYPMLEEGNEQFDADLSNEVMDNYELFVRKYPPSVAMERAVTYVTRAHGVDPAGDNAARQTNVSRNAKAAAAQPPSLDDVGMDSSAAGASQKQDVMAMSQDDFESLSDEEIEKMLNNA